MSFDFQIKADPSQALDAEAKVVAGLKDIEAAVDRVGKQFTTSVGQGAAEAANHVNVMSEALGKVAAIAGVAFTVHEIEDMVDGYAMMSNKLRTLASDQQNLNGLLNATFEIAQNTRMSWESTVDVYNRISKAAGDMGLSQKQVLAITEELGQAAKVSGASSHDAAMTMMELTHAFSIGTLTGREFRVIARDMPGLLTDLAKAAGVTRSEFVEMGMRGHITAKMLVDDLGKAAPEIKRQFEQTIPTITESLTMVHNAAQKFFGETAIGTGIMRKLTDAIQYVARHFDEIGAAITVVIDVVTRLAGVVEDLVHGAWGLLIDTFGNGVNTDGIELSFKNVGFFVASFVDAAIGLFKMLRDRGKELMVDLVAGIGDYFVQLGQWVVQMFENLLNTIIGKVVSLKVELVSAAEKFAIERPNGKFKTRYYGNEPQAADQAIPSGQQVFSPEDLANNAPAQLTPKDMEDYTKAISKAQEQKKYVDFHYDNPLEGKADELRKSVADGMSDAMKESGAKDYWQGLMDKIGTNAGTVSDKAGTAGAPPISKEEEAAAEKLLKELRGIIEGSNSVTAANEKLAHAQQIVDEAMRAGSGPIHDMLEKYGGGALIMDRFRDKLVEALFPFETLVRKTIESSEALRADTHEQERNAEYLKMREGLWKQGVALTDEQELSLRRLIATTQEHKLLLAEEQAQYQAIVGPGEKYELEVRALHDLWDDGTISQEKYNRAIDRSRAAYLNASEDARTFAGGVESAMLKIKDDVTNVGAVIEKTFLDAFKAIEDAIVDLVVKGTADFQKMVESIEADMVRLLLRQAEAGLINAIAGDAGGLPGHATGGSWTVGGNGGTDSQVVAFRATPGEKVTVHNPSQSQQQASPAMQQRPIVNNHIHLDPKGLIKSIGDHPDFVETVSNIAVAAVGPQVALRSRNRGG